MRSFSLLIAENMRTCDICGNSEFSTLPFYYLLDGRKLEGKKCKKCSLMFIDPLPTAEQIEKMYGEDYFSKVENYNREIREKKYIELASEIDFTKPRKTIFTDYIFSHYPSRKFDYLEIGCGPGYLLKSLELMGWNVNGLEISEYSADFGRTHLNLPIKTGNIEDFTDFTENQYDLIYMGDVIEHLTSPSKVVAKFKKMLRPGGLLVLAVPSTLNLPAIKLGFSVYKMLGKKRLMDIPPYHLYEFTPKTITKLLNKHGFEVTDLRNTVKKPSQIRLGGNKLEIAGKLIGQYPAYYLNRFTGKFGDRNFVVAENRK